MKGASWLLAALMLTGQPAGTFLCSHGPMLHTFAQCRLNPAHVHAQVRGQLWRTMGMVHKVLPARAALLPQPRPKQQGWAGPSRLASASFSADIVSRSSASSGACASLLLPPGERNPKSIKVRLSASTSRTLAPWMLY